MHAALIHDIALQRSRDAALTAMRLAIALAGGLLFPFFHGPDLGGVSSTLQLLLITSLGYGLTGLTFWLLIATQRVAAASLRFPMLAADALFAAGVLTWAGAPGIVVYAPALLAVQSGRDRFGLMFGRMSALAMSVVFVGALSRAEEWSGHPLALAAMVAGFWMMVMPGYGKLTIPVAAQVGRREPPSAPPAQTEAAPSRTTKAPGHPVGQGAAVLVAQSNRAGRMLIAKVLERAGYRVVAVENSEAAMAALDQPPGAVRFDAFLVDVDLSGMGGGTLTQYIRTTQFDASGLVIIGLDGSAEASPPARWREIGIDDCLQRPVHPGKLLDCLRQLLREAAPAPAEPAAEAAPEPLSEKIAQTLDMRALRDLENLGGRDFVRDIANQFVADGALALRNLAHSMARGDAALFRDQAHALRSSAANVGARGIYVTCLAWREIEAEDLSRNGATYLQDLHDQFEEASRFLMQYLDGPVAIPPPVAPEVTERAA